MTTVLDVIDGFFGNDPDVLTVPGKALYEFGREVQRFADAYEPPPLADSERMLYLGGWPSANVWLADTGALTMTSLLYADRALARDPIADWFAPERHAVATLLASRPGYRDEAGNPLVAQTRQFLAVAVPGLLAMRDLIERGAVVLVPSRRFLAEQQGAVSALGDELVNQILGDALDFTHRFDPVDLPVEDNVRGAFVFAGGNRDTQVRKAVERATEYFAGEYMLANAYGATYTAPFRLERYMVESGLRGVLDRPGDRVVNALLRTRLPLFQNLTPDVVASVRDDDAFGDMRSTIYSLYRDISPRASADDVATQIEEAETALLAPVLSRLRANAERGPLSRIAGIVSGYTFRVGFGLLVGNTIAPGAVVPSVAAEGVAQAATSALDWSRDRKEPRPARAWQTLFDHSQAVEQEIRLSAPMDGPQAIDWWGIPEQPSMNVSVTSGRLIRDFVPTFPVPPSTGTAPARNARCPCGSGRKFKTCCLEIQEPTRFR